MAPVRSKNRRRGKSTGQNGLAERRGGRERGVGIKEHLRMELHISQNIVPFITIFKISRSNAIQKSTMYKLNY